LLTGLGAHVKGLTGGLVGGPIGAIGKGENQIEGIVGGDPNMTMHATAQTTVDNCVLAIRTDKVPDWGHQRAAVTGPVAGSPAIHVPGMETIGTVVPLPAPRRR